MSAPTWPPPGWHTMRGAAERLGISRQRLYLLVRRLGVPTEHTEAGQLIAAAEVTRLLNRSTRPGRPKQPRS